MCSQLCNPVYAGRADDSTSSSDDGDAPNAHTSHGHETNWFVAWGGWLQHKKVAPCPHIVAPCLERYLQRCEQKDCQQDGACLAGAGFRHGGAIPPRCVLHLFLAYHGASDFHQSLCSRPEDKLPLFQEELAMFGRLFVTALAMERPRGGARAYKSLHKSVKLRREDSTTPATAAKPAIGDVLAWQRGVANQTRPIVLNALLASRRLKQTLSYVWGPRAVSLGTVSVEAQWWQH